MGMPAMNKVHHFARAIWEHEPATLACKRLRPLAPKITTTTSDTFDLKSFIRPESGPRKPGSSDHHKKECPQGGGTRWNPTQEQIGILEMLYRDGMRTPNAQQIEHITARLAKYGKIEGKNVFYWFQNHKARERQKLKRNSLPLISPQPSPSTNSSLLLSLGEGGMEEELGCISQKRKCRSWAFDQCLAEDIRFYNQEYEEDEVEEGEDRTLKLFPLHPERR